MIGWEEREGGKGEEMAALEMKSASQADVEEEREGETGGTVRRIEWRRHAQASDGQ